MKSLSATPRLTPKIVRSVLGAALLSGVVLAPVASQAQLLRGARGPSVITTPIAATDWRTVAPQNLLVIDTTKGRILVELEPHAAPAHVARITTLADRGFYDGLKFHRVLPNFMAQTGDPLGTGEGGSDLPDLAGEFSFRRGRDAGFAEVPNAGGQAVRGLVSSLPVETQPDAQMFVTADMKTPASGLFCPGVFGMARSGSPDSANSQFFLMTGANASLNGAYTALGRVVAGLDVVKALNPGDPDNNGTVANPDVMTRVRIAASIPEAERPTVRVLDARTPSFVTRVDAIRAKRGVGFNICDVDLPSEVTGG